MKRAFKINFSNLRDILVSWAAREYGIPYPFGAHLEVYMDTDGDLTVTVVIDHDMRGNVIPFRKPD